MTLGQTLLQTKSFAGLRLCSVTLSWTALSDKTLQHAGDLPGLCRTRKVKVGGMRTWVSG